MADRRGRCHGRVVARLPGGPGMTGPERRRRGGSRRVLAPTSELLDDDHVGGLLTRIRAVGSLIGAAADVDPAQISAAGWLVDTLAEEAQRRLRETVRQLERSAGRPSTPKARRGRRS